VGRTNARIQAEHDAFWRTAAKHAPRSAVSGITARATKGTARELP
jgi:hypothetical protein